MGSCLLVVHKPEPVEMVYIRTKPEGWKRTNTLIGILSGAAFDSVTEGRLRNTKSGKWQSNSDRVIGLMKNFSRYPQPISYLAGNDQQKAYCICMLGALAKSAHL